MSAGNNDTGLAYNPASQIVTEERSNGAYLWNGAVAIERDYQVNGLNQSWSPGRLVAWSPGRLVAWSPGRLV